MIGSYDLNASAIRTRLSYGLLAGVLLTAALCVPVAGTCQGRKGHKAPPSPPPIEVLVFPTDVGTGVPPGLADLATSVAESRLAAGKKYSPTPFLTSNPSVRRGLLEQTLAPADVKGPFDNGKIRKIVALTGITTAFTASVDDYEYDAAKQQATVVISAQLMDLSGAKPVVRSAAESVTSPPNSVKSASDIAGNQSAVRAAMEKVMDSILNPPPPKPAAK